MNLANLQAAPLTCLAKAIGASIKEQVQQAGSVTDFAEASGVKRSSLYRLFNGEAVGIDVLIPVLQTLGRVDLLNGLLDVPTLPAVILPKARLKRAARNITHLHNSIRT